MVNFEGHIVVFAMIFVWGVYPLIVMRLRPKVFHIKYQSNLFYLYSFFIGCYVTTSTVILFGITRGINDAVFIISILLGLIFETIILYPDKLEQRFKYINKLNNPSIAENICLSYQSCM